MADGTEFLGVTFRGRVVNKSDEWLWVLFNKGDKVVAKYLAPNRISPYGVDADAVKPWRSGLALSSYLDWWKLPSFVCAIVRNNTFSNGIYVNGSPPGFMSQKDDATFGGHIEYDLNDETWGRDLKWYE
jgi:hypothetical protein